MRAKDQGGRVAGYKLVVNLWESGRRLRGLESGSVWALRSLQNRPSRCWRSNRVRHRRCHGVKARVFISSHRPRVGREQRAETTPDLRVDFLLGMGQAGSWARSASGCGTSLDSGSGTGQGVHFLKGAGRGGRRGAPTRGGARPGPAEKPQSKGAPPRPGNPKPRPRAGRWERQREGRVGKRRLKP